MKSPKGPERYTEEETQKHFEAALRGARVAGDEPKLAPVKKKTGRKKRQNKSDG